MRSKFLSVITIVMMMVWCLPADAYKLQRNTVTVPSPDTDTLQWYIEPSNSYELAIDRADFDSIISNPPRRILTLPAGFFCRPVFDRYMMLDRVSLDRPSHPYGLDSAYAWLDDLAFSSLIVNRARQNYMISEPWAIKYNVAMLPEPPKMYHAVVNPITTRIEFQEQKVKTAKLEADIEPKRWLGKFGASLQFSQAYISPNWYQGGNNNLNMLAQISYNLKLNQNLYPKYLFDMTVQYKLGLNSTPDDSIRSYSISEDLFQFNLTTGLKASKYWYYSGNVSFKTQLFNSYALNSRQRKAAFMSPGELNIGLGMTYNRTNAKKSFSLALSMSPLSWNLKTCLSNYVDETTYGIKPGHRTANEIGSSLECNVEWKLCYNIVYHSRLFAFSDYSYLQADWEHTIDFAINRYLSTRFYLHMRYDTTTPRADDSRWHKLQMKEILSFGFNYTFGTV